jgi:hypothetical protein
MVRNKAKSGKKKAYSSKCRIKRISLRMTGTMIKVTRATPLKMMMMISILTLLKVFC